MENRFVINPVPVTLTEAEVFKRFRTKPEDEAAEDIRALLKKVQEIARPKAVCRLCPTRTEGNSAFLADMEFPFPLLAKNLENVHFTLAYVLTCGREVADWAAGLEDAVEQFWADGMMEMLLYKVSGWFTQYTKETWFGEQKMTHLGPGSLKEWPLPQQEPLFRLIGDVEKDIGVTLRPSYLMTPFKSSSGIGFPTESSFVSCRLCPMKKCPNRRAPMDKEYARTQFGVEVE